VRISPKDQANTCELFSSRVTVARDAAPVSNGNGAISAPKVVEPRHPSEARAAFDNLFKK